MELLTSWEWTICLLKAHFSLFYVQMMQKDTQYTQEGFCGNLFHTRFGVRILACVGVHVW